MTTREAAINQAFATEPSAVQVVVNGACRCVQAQPLIG